MKMVFIHGSGATSAVWYYQKQHFKDADTPDLPGHPDGRLCSSIEEYSNWLHGYIQEKNYKDVILAGHSLGGAITLQYALTYPEDLKAIILIGTGARLRVLPLIIETIRSKLNNPRRWMDDFVKPIYTSIDRDLWDKLEPVLLRVGPEPQLNDFLCCDKFDIMDKINSIELPALAIVGDKDNMTPPKYSKYMTDNMPCCRMELIKGGTHLAFMENPQQVNEAIEKFIKELKK